MRMSTLVVASAALVACTKREKTAFRPVTEAQAVAFAKQWAAAAMPCNEGKMRGLIDHVGLGDRFLGDHASEEERRAGRELEKTQVGARVVCAWQEGAESYRFLHVHVVDGQFRPVFRRVREDARTGLHAVAYDELMLGVAPGGSTVRAIDIYSFIAGDWLSAVLRGLTSATLDAGDPAEAIAIAEKVKEARSLQKQGKFTEALALLDTLPGSVRKTRGTQMMRVALAGQVSQPVYAQALDELQQAFPNDPSAALVEIDGAFMRGDYDGALRDIDIVDKAIGGDAWQDAIRAEALIHRGKPGDLAKAKERADAAIIADPELSKSWWARVAVQLAAHEWRQVLATLDEMQPHFHLELHGDALAKLAAYKELAATPEFAAWSATHP